MHDRQSVSVRLKQFRFRICRAFNKNTTLSSPMSHEYVGVNLEGVDDSFANIRRAGIAHLFERRRSRLWTTATIGWRDRTRNGGRRHQS